MRLRSPSEWHSEADNIGVFPHHQIGASVKSIHSLALVIGLLASATAFAQAPAGAPAGSTALCKDGAYTSTDTKKGACSGHQGVKEWFGDKQAAAPAKSTPAAAAPATDTSTTKADTKTASKAPAAGGGAGQVWVNTESKVYHCPGTKWYGKTKQGEYMTEAAAKSAGNHADHGKACTG
jgi:hypothetical protein